MVPDPLTRTRAETDVGYLTPKPKNLREVEFLKTIRPTPSSTKDRPKFNDMNELINIQNAIKSPSGEPKKQSSSTEEPPKDQVVRDKTKEKLGKKKAAEAANLLADSLLNKMGMSQDVRATELNGSRQQEEILF